MLSAELVCGASYAFRERKTGECPVRQVMLVTKIGRGGKIRIRFEDEPHPGLEEYANTRQLIALWSERTAVIRDEERLAQLREYARPLADKALATAANAVLQSTGEADAHADAGVTSMPEAELQRIMQRAALDGAPARLHHLGFRDRRGLVHLPLDALVVLARAFAAAEPDTVNRHLDAEEDELRCLGAVPGDRWWHRYLRDQGPGFALARRWAGLEAEKDSMRQENARLRGLVVRASHELQAAGKDTSARRLIRALQGL